MGISNHSRARHKINWRKSASDNRLRAGLNGTDGDVIILYRFFAHIPGDTDMTALPPPRTFRVGTYNNGQPYVPARGRYAPRERVEDYLAPSHAVIDLPRQKPTAAEFVRVIVREMKIRFYSQKTIKTYRNDLARMLRWFGNPPHLLTREDVRCYLEFLVDAGASVSQVGNHLSAIRAAFDKMCGYAVTLGLQSPRRGKRLPVVLSAEEVTRLLQAAPSLRDKLLIGLMYATGMRVSEVCRLKWRDLDFDRRVVNIWEGKGRTDRQVMLPVSFEPLLRELSKTFQPGDYLFPGERSGRHLSPRSAERAMERAVKIAGIGKRCTCPARCAIVSRRIFLNTAPTSGISRNFWGTSGWRQPRFTRRSPSSANSKSRARWTSSPARLSHARRPSRSGCPVHPCPRPGPWGACRSGSAAARVRPRWPTWN